MSTTMFPKNAMMTMITRMKKMMITMTMMKTMMIIAEMTVEIIITTITAAIIVVIIAEIIEEITVEEVEVVVGGPLTKPETLLLLKKLTLLSNKNNKSMNRSGLAKRWPRYQLRQRP